MRLASHHWGEGDRVAVLIHGLYNLGIAWHATAQVLVSHGYRVIAVDLPGHGGSPRAPHYPASLIRDAVVAAVPHRPELLMGHSLGAYAARLSSPVLQPKRIVYVDPAFDIMDGDEEQRQARRAQFERWISLTEAGVRSANPTWSDPDVHIELLGRDMFDPAFLQVLLDDSYAALEPPTGAPVLVVAGDRDSTVFPERVRLLEAEGAVVCTVPGTTHNLNRDDHAGFIEAITDWIEPHEVSTALNTGASRFSDYPR